MAAAGVAIFVISTFDTDWVMVRLVDGDKAAEEWRRRGHTVTEAVPTQSSKKPSKSGHPGKKTKK